MLMNKKIAAIVVTYNRCELLVESIDALLNSSVLCDILIIDNNSTDNTRDKIEKYVHINNFKYFNTGKNIGGAGGFNFGIRKAYELGYDYFWLMDDDTIVKKDTLQKLIDASTFLNNDFGFLSSLALWTDGTECVMNKHEIERNIVCSGDLLKNNLLKISSATFVSFFTKREIVEKVGLPIKEYFIWGDDTEYSLRISRLFSSYFVFNSQVIHKMKENKGTGDIYKLTDIERIKRIGNSIRNDCCTYKRISIKKLLGFTKRTLTSIKKVLANKNPHKATKIKIIAKGYLFGLFAFNPKIEKVSK